MNLLRRLARRAGRMVTRSELVAALPGPADDGALEKAMSSLVMALGAAKLIQPVLASGYRLALDPAAGPVPVGGHCLHGDAR